MPSHALRDRVLVGYVADHDLAIDALEPPGLYRVEHSDDGPLGQQRADGRSADKAAAAGHQHTLVA